MYLYNNFKLLCLVIHRDHLVLVVITCVIGIVGILAVLWKCATGKWPWPCS